MIICICHRISDRDIARSVREGCESFDALQFELGVATGCGACHDCAQASFHTLRQGAAGQLQRVSTESAHGQPGVQALHGERLAHPVHPVHVLRRLTPVQTLGDGNRASRPA